MKYDWRTMISKYIIYVYTTEGKYTFEPCVYNEAQMFSVNIRPITNIKGFKTETEAMFWFSKNKENFKVLFKNLKVEKVLVKAVYESAFEKRYFKPLDLSFIVD